MQVTLKCDCSIR